MLIRKFVTTDGEVLAEDGWSPSPILKCFYCGIPTTLWNGCNQCPSQGSQSGEHELVTLVEK